MTRPPYKVHAYISHTIRGRAGNNATDEEMRTNNQAAIRVGEILKECCSALSVYIPGYMDAFLEKHGVRPLNVVDALLDLDCAIVEQSDLLLVYTPNDYISGGMKTEIDHALKTGIQVIYFSDTLLTTISMINYVVDSLLKQRKNQKLKEVQDG